MRLLITSDAFGGLGMHAAALAAGLRRRGHAVRLVRFGSPDAPFPLEWMTPADGEAGLRRLQGDLGRARAHLSAVAAAWRPDLLHANQFAFVNSLPGLPTLLGVHSDVISWWRWVRHSPPPDDAYHRWYGGLARAALDRAAAVVAPSAACAGDLAAQFDFSGSEVIHNGSAGRRAPRRRQRMAVTVGRGWDEAKQFGLLLGRRLPCPVLIAGPRQKQWVDSAPTLAESGPRVRWLGSVPHRQLPALLARARVYIAPSAYEPFGLAPLEAASAGCALLLNDIPSFREVWGDAAVFFHQNDGDDLARQLARLVDQPALCRAWGVQARARARERFGIMRMAAAYERIYQQLLTRSVRCRAQPEKVARRLKAN